MRDAHGRRADHILQADLRQSRPQPPRPVPGGKFRFRPFMSCASSPPLRLLVRQQPDFLIDSAVIARHAAVRAHNTVARDHNGDRIMPDSPADGLRRHPRAAHALRRLRGKRAVGRHLTAGNLQQQLPDHLPEGAALRRQRQLPCGRPLPRRSSAPATAPSVSARASSAPARRPCAVWAAAPPAECRSACHPAPSAPRRPGARKSAR